MTYGSDEGSGRFFHTIDWRQEMPRQILRFTRGEQEEYRKRLRSLQEMGVPAGSVSESSPKPNPLTLTQVWHGLARVYELPSNRITVALYATLVVLNPGAMIGD